MRKLCMHQRVDELGNECTLLTFLISKTSWNDGTDVVQTMEFQMNDDTSFSATLHGFKYDIDFTIMTSARNMMCSASMFTGSGTLLFSKTLKEPTKIEGQSSFHYNLMSLTSDDECFQKLKQHRNDSLILICRIILRSGNFYLDLIEAADESTDCLNYMKKLADTLKNSSETSLKEKVTLRVGDETEIVNKAVLCARSTFFAAIFQSNLEEVKENVVTLSDITMPLLKVLISFLYSGKLSYSDFYMESNDGDFFDVLCLTYCAADRYGIAELRHTCVDLLLPLISLENIFRVSKLAFAHSDERLKSTVKTMIAENIETLVLENEWNDFFKDEPQIVVEALTFFDI